MHELIKQLKNQQEINFSNILVQPEDLIVAEHGIAKFTEYAEGKL